MQKFSLISKDAAGKNWPITDLASGGTFSSTPNGYYQYSQPLKRPSNQSKEDIGINNELTLYDSRMKVAWAGRDETDEPELKGATQGQLVMTGTGYWASTYDNYFFGTLGTATTPQAMLASLLTSTYLPQLSTSTASLLATGITSKTYITGSSGIDEVAVGDVILQVCGYGYAPGGTFDITKMVVPSVWEGRVLQTNAVLNNTLAPDYFVSVKASKSIKLRRSLSQTQTRVIIKYKDSGTGLVTHLSPLDDSATQTKLGTTLGGSFVPYVRTVLKDITSLGSLTSAEATSIGNALLNRVKRVRTDSTSIVIPKDLSIYSVSAGSEIFNHRVKAGNWIRIPDLLPRLSGVTLGTTGNDPALSDCFYIIKTDYNLDTGELTITPESSSQLDDIISGNNLTP